MRKNTKIIIIALVATFLVIGIILAIVLSRRIVKQVPENHKIGVEITTSDDAEVEDEIQEVVPEVIEVPETEEIEEIPEIEISEEEEIPEIEIPEVESEIVSDPKEDFNEGESFGVTPFETSDKYKVTASSLMVRTGPSTNYQSIGELAYGTFINPVGICDTGWYAIEFNGEIGYVSNDFVELYTPKFNADGLSDDASDYVIVVNSKNNTLRIYYQNDLLSSFDCATGKASTPTPEGCYSVVNKCVNPAYGSIPGGASNNPLGKRWMGLSIPGGCYGIHGNSNEASIGTNASAGCVRMHNDEVEDVYDIIPIGTTVIIMSTDEDDGYIASQYGIYLNIIELL